MGPLATIFKKHLAFSLWATLLVAFVSIALARLWTEADSKQLEGMHEQVEMKEKRKKELQLKIVQQRQLNKELKKKDDKTLLRIAREELGLVKKNELVIKIKKEDSI